MIKLKNTYSLTSSSTSISDLDKPLILMNHFEISANQNYLFIAIYK